MIKINKDGLDKMKEMLDHQGSNGNWDYDPYMHGLYNGMEYMLAMVENRDPEFRDPPKEWLFDKKCDLVAVIDSQET